mmetsp:Transcript_11481/g.17227  ORF Transcript_11481/g.17227 Transcript_11481/m.17227 type:complete len:80 (+) Transcript_11481:226-465(+)
MKARKEASFRALQNLKIPPRVMYGQLWDPTRLIVHQLYQVKNTDGVLMTAKKETPFLQGRAAQKQNMLLIYSRVGYCKL